MMFVSDKKLKEWMEKSLAEGMRAIAHTEFPNLNYEKIAKFQTNFIMKMFTIVTYTTFIGAFTWYFPKYLGIEKETVILILLSLIFLHLKTSKTSVEVE